MLAEFIQKKNKHGQKKIRRGEQEGKTHAFIPFLPNGLYSKIACMSDV